MISASKVSNGGEEDPSLNKEPFGFSEKLSGDDPTAAQLAASLHGRFLQNAAVLRGEVGVKREDLEAMKM